MNSLKPLQLNWSRLTALLGGVVVLASTSGHGPAVSYPARWHAPALDPQEAESVIQPQSYELATANGVTISGDDGRFVGQVVINGTGTAAWDVLTDYNNFAAFLPNVAASRLLNRNGSRVTFEQVNVLRVAAFPVRNRVVIAATEQRPNQIQFTVTDGDDQILQGVWQIQQTGSGQVVVTHQAAVVSQTGLQRGVYASVYPRELETTLVSLRREIERRSR